MKMSRPDLVVPYRTVSMREKLYPSVITIAIALLTFLVLVSMSVKGAY